MYLDAVEVCYRISDHVNRSVRNGCDVRDTLVELRLVALLDVRESVLDCCRRLSLSYNIDCPNRSA